MERLAALGPLDQSAAQEEPEPQVYKDQLVEMAALEPLG